MASQVLPWQISGIGTLGSALDIGGNSSPYDLAVNTMLIMASALDDQSVPEETDGLLHHHYSISIYFQQVQNLPKFR